jgi:hypothetical protein
MIEQFVEDLPMLLSLSQKLADLFVLLSLTYTDIELLITKCIVWKLLYLITAFSHEEDREVLIPDIKDMILAFVHTLRNILIQ